MRVIILITIAIIMLPLAAYAVPTASITVPEAGDHYYWFSYSDINGKQVTTTPRSFKDKKTTADLPLVKDKVPSCKLFVLDAKTGNEAVLSIASKPGAAFKFDLKPTNFDTVRRVGVRITSTSSGEAAAAATVTIEGGDKKAQTQVLDPSSSGVVQFTDIPAGTAKITVEYGKGKTSSQDVDILLEREAAAPTVEVPVVGEIETIQAAASTEDGKGKPAGGGAESRPINMLMPFVGLAILVIAVYVIYSVLRKRKVELRKVLRDIGVELPEDQKAAPAQPTPAQPVDPTVCPFCGGKKDPTTGACLCSVTPGPTAVVTGGGSGPRLIATQGVYAGSIYALDPAGGELVEPAGVTIGREESNAIAFPQDGTASRHHARITVSNGEFTVHDEGSSNGTFVNGVKVAEQVLKPGDEIQIGNTKLRFEA